MRQLENLIIKKAVRLRREYASYSETYVWVGASQGLTGLFKLKMSAVICLGVEPLQLKGSMWDCDRKFYLATKNNKNATCEKLDVKSSEVENNLVSIQLAFGRQLKSLVKSPSSLGVCAFAKSHRVENGLPDMGCSDAAVAVQWSNDTNCFLAEFSTREGSYIKRGKNGATFVGTMREPVRILAVLDQTPSAFESYGQTYEQSYGMKYIGSSLFSHVTKLDDVTLQTLVHNADSILMKAKSNTMWESPGNLPRLGLIEGCMYNAIEDFPIDGASTRTRKTMCIWDDNDIAHHVSLSDFDD